jgi:hypothetical protein
MTATIIQFPPRPPFAVRVERERDSEGWLVRTHNREHGWLSGDFSAPLHDARELGTGFGVAVISS